MELRIKEVAKLQGMDLQTLSKRLGITYQALNARMVGNPSIKVLQEIADVLGVSVFEIIAADDNTYHSYDENKNWKGIVKK
ncbi:helix-turn-helix domain-containing protein [Sphingobacterium sp. N143]|uniref:helix-turn-helix domain-containing protein n=1 Tax=Sphingobacterium sp. N143 TaxID=2746727 RepID=UPI00257632DC|nr:helix-turn-helix domain-containing protein [Sphingobacterium sp. N143]MDM1294328.1 helix-turn-helix domain-containing protein [Sphingobacterium sp. N143]